MHMCMHVCALAPMQSGLGGRSMASNGLICIRVAPSWSSRKHAAGHIDRAILSFSRGMSKNTNGMCPSSPGVRLDRAHQASQSIHACKHDHACCCALSGIRQLQQPACAAECMQSAGIHDGWFGGRLMQPCTMFMRMQLTFAAADRRYNKKK